MTICVFGGSCDLDLGADDAENLIIRAKDGALVVHGEGRPLLEPEAHPVRKPPARWPPGRAMSTHLRGQVR